MCILRISCVVFVLLLFAGSPAHAAERVIVVSGVECCSDDAWPEAEQKLAREFRLEGFDVEFRSGRSVSPEEQRSDLEALLRDDSVQCAVRVSLVESVQADIQLQIADGTTDSVHRRLRIRDVSSPESPDVAAYKTLEVFRTTLFELRGTASPLPLPPPPAPVSPAPGTSTDRFAAGAGIGGLFYPTSAPARLAPCITLEWRPGPVSVQIEGSFGFIGRDLESDVHTATLAIHHLLARSGWTIPAHRRWRLFLGVFGGATFIRSRGHSTADVPLRTESTVVAAFGASVQMEWSVWKRLCVNVFLDGGFQLPRTTVELAGTRISTFGVPLLHPGIRFTLLIP